MYEDEKVAVLLSKFPTNYGHTLIIPKTHIESIDDLSEEEYLQLQKILKVYNKKINQNLKPEKIYIMLMAEEIPHAHFHLIPRYKDDPKGPDLLNKKGELDRPEELIRKINNE